MHRAGRLRGRSRAVLGKGPRALMAGFVLSVPVARERKAHSSSLCVFCSGPWLRPQPQQCSGSEFLAADASVAPVHSDGAVLREPSQA